MLEENYNHLDIEDKIYAFWESNKLFEPKKNKKKKNGYEKLKIMNASSPILINYIDKEEFNF